MIKALVFGATGHLGSEMVAALKSKNFFTTAVVRSRPDNSFPENDVDDFRISPLSSSDDFKGICAGYDLVISALGKSVSPFDRSKRSFRQVDLEINKKILEDALQNKVKKFVYVSALDAEKYPDLEYFAVHQEMANLVALSGIDYTIVKPPALFSAFIDLMKMAAKGQLVNMGKGEMKTNPISERDLARIVVDSLAEKNYVLAAGGPEVLTRKRINEIIQENINPAKKIRTVPMGLVRSMLPLIKIFDRNSFDKIAFFTEVMMHDTIAPIAGSETLQQYVNRKKHLP
ncbi:SDR family oxidoreductase [Pollutibacter soli]|uniref:SDR family oxidoreductase n=1 Tax=Pollutibacter soli TaxID=3034157 RepID=UPI0030141972